MLIFLDMLEKPMACSVDYGMNLKLTLELSLLPMDISLASLTPMAREVLFTHLKKKHLKFLKTFQDKDAFQKQSRFLNN